MYFNNDFSKRYILLYVVHFIKQLLSIMMKYMIIVVNSIALKTAMLCSQYFNLIDTYAN